MNLEEIKQEIQRIAAIRGWSTEISDKLVSTLTELGEVADAWKKGYPENLKAEELADLIISTLDLSLFVCPRADMDKVVAEKLRLLEYPKSLPNDFVVVDVSAFLYEHRMQFLLNLLEEEDLCPKRVILADEIYGLFSKMLRNESGSKVETQKRLVKIAGTWEGYYRRFPKVAEWFGNERFVLLLRTFFERWKPIPTSELIGYNREKNPFNAKKLKEKLGKAGELLYDELETAYRTRSAIICLSRATRRFLVKIGHVLIEVPHQRKKKWMLKHKWVGYLAFLYFTGLSQRTISSLNVGSFVEDILRNASPFVRHLFADLDILKLGRTVFDTLALPALDVAIGLASVAILFDSVDQPRVVLAP